MHKSWLFHLHPLQLLEVLVVLLAAVFLLSSLLIIRLKSCASKETVRRTPSQDILKIIYRRSILQTWLGALITAWNTYQNRKPLSKRGKSVAFRRLSSKKNVRFDQGSFQEIVYSIQEPPMLLKTNLKEIEETSTEQASECAKDGDLFEQTSPSSLSE